MDASSQSLNVLRLKLKVLIDFILECTIPLEENFQAKGMSSKADLEKQWTFYVDDSSSSSGSEVRLILTGSEGDITEYALHFKFPTTNIEQSMRP